MRTALVALGALALFAIAEGIYYVVQYLGDRRAVELRRRLQSIGRGAALDADLLRRGRRARSPWAAAVVAHLPGAHRLERLLEQADSAWTVAHLFAVAAAGAAACGVLAAILRSGTLGIAALAVAGGAAPFAQVLAARSSRSQRLSDQLPEALEMMARSLRAGHAMTAAFQVVATEMPEPVSVEFARAYEEQRLGLSLERAVVQMSERSPANGDLKIFAVSTVIQRETGGNLAEILDKIADTVRQRFRFKGKVRALTAEGRASAAVLGFLPFVVAVMLSIISPGYLAALSGTPLGRTILAMGAGGWLVGLVWLYRMTQLEV